VADQVAGKSRVVVGRVVGDRQALHLHEPVHVGPAQAQQRPEHVAAHGGHAGQPRHAGPSRQAQQQRLRLVVGGVAQHQPAGVMGSGDTAQCGIALAARLRLHARGRHASTVTSAISSVAPSHDAWVVTTATSSRSSRRP
jgi:hypothetical protein